MKTNINKYFFGLLLILFPQLLQAVIIRVVTLDWKGKTITLFFDQHGPSKGNPPQLKAVTKYIETYAKTKKEPLRILIEQAPESYNDRHNGRKNKRFHSLLSYLKERAHKVEINHKHVRMEDIEIRHCSGVAECICNASDEARENIAYYSYSAGGNLYPVAKITFQDVLDEFDLLQKNLQKKNDLIQDLALRKILNTHMENAQRPIFKNVEKTTIFEWCKESKLDNRKHAKNSMIHTFKYLLDLHILHKILDTKSKKIVLMAGAEHCGNLHSMFNENNAVNLFFTYSTKVKDGNLYKAGPSPAKDLLTALDAKRPWKYYTVPFIYTAATIVIVTLLYKKYSSLPGPDLPIYG